MQLTARYFQGPRSAVLCLLHRLLEGSQKLKPEGVNRLFRFVTQGRHPEKRRRGVRMCVGMCACVCVHVLAAEHNLCARVRLLMKPG